MHNQALEHRAIATLDLTWWGWTWPECFMVLTLLFSLIEIILNELHNMDSILRLHNKDFVKQLCLQKNNDDWTLLMNACCNQPKAINAIFDYMVGLLKIWEIVDEKYDTALSNETILLCESYADGINYYIEENNKNIKQYIYPVSGKDIIAATPPLRVMGIS